MKCARGKSHRTVGQGFATKKLSSACFCFKGEGSFSHVYKAKLDHDVLAAWEG
jgi:hypothetical protein